MSEKCLSGLRGSATKVLVALPLWPNQSKISTKKELYKTSVDKWTVRDNPRI